MQADLKAFARCGVHGMTAITAITAQSTTGVYAIHPVPPAIVIAQMRAVLGDIGVDAVKVGMLGTAEVTLAVASALRELPSGTPVVVDPVMVAESGAQLLQADAQRALAEEILPLATVLTPNVPEARVLVVEAGTTMAADRDELTAVDRDELTAVDRDELTVADRDELTDAEAEELARAVLARGPRTVVLTGGHRARTVDLFVDRTPGAPAVEIPGERHREGAAHGSGCTHSSVLAAQLALGLDPLAAARVARRLAGEAVAQGLRDIGAGAGPVDILGLRRLRDAIIEGR